MVSEGKGWKHPLASIAFPGKGERMETPPKTRIRAGGEGRDRPLWRRWDVGMGFSGASPAFHGLHLPRFASDPIPAWIF